MKTSPKSSSKSLKIARAREWTFRILMWGTAFCFFFSIRNLYEAESLSTRLVFAGLAGANAFACWLQVVGLRTSRGLVRKYRLAWVQETEWERPAVPDRMDPIVAYRAWILNWQELDLSRLPSVAAGAGAWFFPPLTLPSLDNSKLTIGVLPEMKLHSGHQGQPWDFMTGLEAACPYGGERHTNPPPEKRCTCGIYGWKDHMVQHIQWDTAGRYLQGIFLGWGRWWEHYVARDVVGGYRVQFARPAAMMVNDYWKNVPGYEWRRFWTHQLAHNYNVPVFEGPTPTEQEVLDVCYRSTGEGRVYGGTITRPCRTEAEFAAYRAGEGARQDGLAPCGHWNGDMHNFQIETMRIAVPGESHSIQLPAWQVNKFMGKDPDLKGEFDTTTVWLPAREGHVDLLKISWGVGVSSIYGHAVAMGW